MDDSAPAAPDGSSWWEAVPAEWRPWILWGALLLLALIILRAVVNRIGAALRRHRAPTIHPNLQKYNVDHAQLDKQRREDAAKIVATSTGGRLVGYRIVRQVEAVFVEGYRTPEEATIALKAAAAQRGANGIVNVSTDRTMAGKCSASGDAVVIDQPLSRPSRPPNAKPH
jgi:uncharacterized protein YbjQ (UPF0145 family)